MKLHSLAAVLAWVAMTGMSFPFGLFAGESQRGASPLPARDVALTQDGSLAGYVMDAAGHPIAQAPLQLAHEGQLMAAVNTDEFGRFTIHGLKGGVYSLSDGVSQYSIRAWNRTAAPPAASAALIVVSQPTVRGQEAVTRNPKKLKLGVLTALGLSTAAIITSIVLPLALDDDYAS